MSLLSPNLQAFFTVAKTGKVLLAAKELHVGQTGITQRIRSLEKSLGVSLFIRSRKGMGLTQEGQALLNYCQQSMEIERRTYSIINNGGTKATVFCTITGPTSLITSRISPQCMHLYEKWPKLNLNFFVDDSERRHHLVKAGIVDFAICRPDQVTAEMDSKILKTDDYVLVGHPSWKQRSVEKIIESERIVDFSEEDPMTLNYLKTYDLIKYTRKPRIYINSNDILIKVLCQGIAYCVLSKTIVKSFLKTGELILLNNGRSMKEEIALIWQYRTDLPAYFKDIIHAIK